MPRQPQSSQTRGEPPPYHGAVSMQRVVGRLHRVCQLVQRGHETLASDSVGRHQLLNLSKRRVHCGVHFTRVSVGVVWQRWKELCCGLLRRRDAQLPCQGRREEGKRMDPNPRLAAATRCQLSPEDNATWAWVALDRECACLHVRTAYPLSRATHRHVYYIVERP